MKLVIAIVQTRDADSCAGALTSAGHACTRLASFGGFLDRDNVTLMVGVDDPQVDAVLEIIRTRVKQRSASLEAAPAPAPVGVVMPPPLDVEVGGATVFVVDVARFERL